LREKKEKKDNRSNKDKRRREGIKRSYSKDQVGEDRYIRGDYGEGTVG